VGLERRSGSSEPEYAGMGDRLRQARRARGLSLRRLAEVVGVSPSLISQVETGRAKPSVNTLYALANELGVSLDVLLFMDTQPPVEGGGGDALMAVTATTLPHDPVQRAASRSSIRLGSGVVWERLTTESIRNVDFLHVTYEVGGESSPAEAFQRHSGQEWGYILSGTLTVRIGFDEYVLQPGDAISFDSATPHRLFNGGDVPARAVWFVQGRGSVDVAKR
jgi:transcriptional regulator with XRE-family HTH domain